MAEMRARAGNRRARSAITLPDDVEVTTKWMRSDDRRGADCICCDGNHVFCYSTVEAPEVLRDWMDAALFRAPEGARLRFSVELIVPARAMDGAARG